jgi:hypothetical protein
VVRNPLTRRGKAKHSLPESAHRITDGRCFFVQALLSKANVEQHGSKGIEHHAAPTIEQDSGSHGQEHGHDAGQEATAAEMGMGD